MPAKKPFALVILDGWGYREDSSNNAIANAKTPIFDGLMAGTSTLISASGLDVGLPDGQMGNSEVGHTNIGAGRIVYQDLTRITKAIADGEFFDNSALTGAIDKAAKSGKAVHIMGLVSVGGVHSHEDHIAAAVEMAVRRGAENVYLHCFLDGRDTAPRSANNSLARFDELFTTLGRGRIATLIGRYYAMDRDNNWDRVEKAYSLLTEAKGVFTYASSIDALEAAYSRNENDEFIQASEIRAKGQPSASIDNGDSLIFMNFRADRAREISRSFLPTFNHFKREKVIELAEFVTLTKYASDINSTCAYPSDNLVNTFGEWLSKQGQTQLRISETEKYAHVTFFFNGGIEEKFKGEERTLIASPKVATYDLQPEMNSKELTDKLIAAIKSGDFDQIICNYPNGDMVGHTGVYTATVKACEAVDLCLARVVEAIKEVDGQLLITADHGNAEMMINPTTGSIHTAHTNLLVPLIYVGSKNLELIKGGRLSDLAPTILALTETSIPSEMTGKRLFNLK
ncbi:2,3-bisphosphoglycerate-independent phosphoglycerate mutase [Candidatus Enterovibrio escicola]|uniref:2,3-bisphosphoglycerate-independent phosphoglycerate mutase n=1 Tax=Candidatus Enterovibrio escicola TaxID=1927127 RepID=A0A2A5T4S1_9GAMM|nr:2,3-bisphosphoglycerate-independent phosphoglycerate mutase [Candidatus Enterovibrio escacola]PCS23118.1 2,3-bisphosphoglycerate-independent phosphoglycerate mutase [Candidatus Enterovibrio escacola]